LLGAVRNVDLSQVKKFTRYNFKRRPFFKKT
jgi:hypothetical protein